jgi:hypothetical protein
LALVTTVTPPTCAVFSAALAAAPLDAEAGALDDAPPATLALDAGLPLDDELEHAAALTATAAVPAAASIVNLIPMDISFADSCLFRYGPPDSW